jgi:hypothetical protein
MVDVRGAMDVDLSTEGAERPKLQEVRRTSGAWMRMRIRTPGRMHFFQVQADFAEAAALRPIRGDAGAAFRIADIPSQVSREAQSPIATKSTGWAGTEGMH